MGEIYVDFSRYGWFPARLPSEEQEEDDEEDDEQLFVRES
jgi:hypothetical protein